MKKLLAVFCASAALAACGTPSVDDLLADPELLQKTFTECSQMSAQKAQNDEACVNAMKAFSIRTSERVQSTMDSVADALRDN